MSVLDEVQKIATLLNDEIEKHKRETKELMEAEKEKVATLKTEMLQQVEKEKSDWENQKKIMKKYKNEEFSSVIKLNIGGTKFQTSKETLIQKIFGQDHFFSSLMSGNFTITKDDEGCIFIDREGKHFQYVLNYLREGGNLKKWPKDPEEFEELKLEFDYYQLPLPIHPLEPEVAGINYAMSNLGAKLKLGTDTSSGCLVGDDSNSSYSYAQYPQYLQIQLAKPYFVNHMRCYFYDQDARSHSVLIEASRDETQWDILFQSTSKSINGAFTLDFSPKEYMHFRFSGTNTANNYMTLNSLNVQYKKQIL